ncbi:MAG TPA: peptide-methionine (S)-S-oxide reductase MsrA [Candidatus Paceibacterota bacterium]|nr:peptide-methionine (S)-S-oxide reductase MsrA [Candidatus Paceibacterota bacterium]
MTEVAMFGGGCFWCTEAVFKMLKGVSKVEPGYAGGKAAKPTYEQVCTGATGHAEVIRIEFDPAQISYRDLMTVFFGSHDATQLNRQGNDVGTQYRSAIFPTTPAQAQEARAFIAQLNASATKGDPIVTTVEEGATFSPAEDYHKDYYARNTHQGYCQLIIAPKLEKVQEQFADLLATHPKA